MKRLFAFGLSLGLVAALAVPAVAAPADGVKGGGAWVNTKGTVYGSVAVNATVGETDSGVVNVEEYETDGTFSQHWVGDVTEIAFDDGLAYICGEVRVLELGTNTNTGLFFRMVVKDNGEPGTDKLDWNRKATEAEASCPYGAGSINKPLIEGNLTVRASD